MIRTVTSNNPYELATQLNKLEGKWHLVSVVKHGNEFVAFLQKQDD